MVVLTHHKMMTKTLKLLKYFSTFLVNLTSCYLRVVNGWSMTATVAKSIVVHLIVWCSL